MRIDAYIQHLIRHGAEAMELESNQPAKFRFQSGERLSSTRVEHKEVVFVVKEAADEAALQGLARSRQATFLHDLDGLSFRLTVQVVSNDCWRLSVAPADAAGVAAAAARRPNLEPPMPQVPRDRPSIAAPRVDAKPGEPRMNRFLREMVRLDASDLHLTTGAPPMVRLHGAMVNLEGHGKLDEAELNGLMLEILPERNKREFEQDWDADFAHAIEGLSRFRANYFRDRNGPGAVFRQIPFSILPFDKLGLSQKVLDLCWLTKGLVLVTGPTGSGKSTTLATLVDYINQNRADHIITIEDPIEFVHPNKRCLVNQREVGMHTRSFKKALRAALREDPDIVLVGEMRDLETIAIAIETAETGHLVFGTLHTTSATSTIDRIIDQFPPEQQAQIRTMLSESLRGVIAQVLCKKKGGGRAAAYEILITTPAISNLIREGKTYQIASMLQTGRNIGMQTMNDHLLQHVQNGVVEPEEAYMKSNDKQTFKGALEKAGIPMKL
ncbi:MAG TPA: type IV pilus twitching motility protein PilT [Polyangiaceae bacterium]|nr:type IV pilus twitching motility protein PilT [Polyangiaceae bacterium]